MALLFKPDTVRFYYADGSTQDVDGQLSATDPSVAFYLTERIPEAPYTFMCDNEDIYSTNDNLLVNSLLVNARVEHIKHNSIDLLRKRIFKVAKTPSNYQSDDITSSCSIFLSEEGIG
jgi:hypothetical protein